MQHTHHLHSTNYTHHTADAQPSNDEEMLVVPGSENGHVEESSEYRFHLYRHWSLYDSMYHSPYIAAKMNVWNNQGTAQLLVSLFLFVNGVHMLCS